MCDRGLEEVNSMYLYHISTLYDMSVFYIVLYIIKKKKYFIFIYFLVGGGIDKLHTLIKYMKSRIHAMLVDVRYFEREKYIANSKRFIVTYFFKVLNTKLSISIHINVNQDHCSIFNTPAYKR
mgnify:CR=1 FL=1